MGKTSVKNYWQYDLRNNAHSCNRYGVAAARPTSERPGNVITCFKNIYCVCSTLKAPITANVSERYRKLLVVNVVYFPSYQLASSPHASTSQVIWVTTAAISWRNGYLYSFMVRQWQDKYHQVERPLGIVGKEEEVTHPSKVIPFSAGILNTAYLVLAPAACEIKCKILNR